MVEEQTGEMEEVEETEEPAGTVGVSEMRSTEESESTETDETATGGGEEMDDEASGQSGAGSASASGQPAKNPFDDFIMVSMTIPGLMAGKSASEDHVSMIFRRMQKKHISAIGKLKNRFYRDLKIRKAFKIDNKYFIPKEQEKAVDQNFQDIWYDFQAEKKAIADDLIKNWQQYVDEVYKEYPDFLVPREKAMELRPASVDFISMDYTKKSLTSFISEHAGLSNLVNTSGGMTPDMQKRFENQKVLIEAKIRDEFAHKMEDLQEMDEKLKGMVKKTGKRYAKMALRFDEEMENYVRIGDLLGEKDSAKMKVEAMLEGLAENIKNRGDGKQ